MKEFTSSVKHSVSSTTGPTQTNKNKLHIKRMLFSAGKIHMLHQSDLFTYVSIVMVTLLCLVKVLDSFKEVLGNVSHGRRVVSGTIVV